MSILQKLTIPMMGSVENGRLLEWLVNEGDNFKQGDPLYSLETDKTVTEVEAEENGILVRYMGAAEDEFKMGDPIALVASSNADPESIRMALEELDAPAESHDVAANTEAVSVVAMTQSSPKEEILRKREWIKSSPRARYLAREHNIDIANVTPTGPRGVVTGEDVLAVKQFIDHERSAAPVMTQERVAGAMVVSTSSASTETSTPSALNISMDDSKGSFEFVKHSMMRKTIAANMRHSKSTAAHLTADMDVDLTALMALRGRYKKSGQTSPSILSFFASNAARLLQEHKTLNATYEDEGLKVWNSINLNIAVDTEAGLIVPVLKHAHLLSALEISRKIAALAEEGRLGKLGIEHMTGGTFTISNPGALGPVVRAEAVLNPGQVALMGLPGIVHKPVAVQLGDGSYAVQVRPIIRVGLTFDHRALDGGPVVRFLNALKYAIENIS